MYFFTSVLFHRSVPCRRVSHPVSTWRDPCAGSLHSSRWFPFHEKTNLIQGWPALHLGQVREHLNWCVMSLPALLGGRGGGGVIWFFGYFIYPYIAQFMGCDIGRIHYDLKVLFCYRHLLPLIVIIMQDCSQALKIWMPVELILWSPIDYLSLPLLSWGCMCFTGPFQFRWLKGYIYNSCYHHYRIGSINLTHRYHIFPWLCAWDVRYITSWHLLHIHSGKTGMLFSLLLYSIRLTSRSHKFVCTLHHLIIIIVQTYLKTLNL